MNPHPIVPSSREISTANDEIEWPENDTALLELSQDGQTFLPENFWCVKDAFEGVQIFGGTGSGKTSGSGKALARAFLDSNFGGLVLTAKTDEADNWREYARETEREEDLIIVDSSCEQRFNFLRYEMDRPGRGAGHTENLVNLFCAILEVSERSQGQGGTNDSYWQRTLKQLLRNAIDLSLMSVKQIDLPTIYRIIASAPRLYSHIEDPKWREESMCLQMLTIAEEDSAGTSREEDFLLTREYWLKEFPGLAEETRSVIVSTFTSMADCFLRGMLRKMFCADTTFQPEDSFEGRIIVLDLPVKEFNELGQFAQTLFKYVWQKAVERRVPQGISREEGERTIRPLFLWADESQFFVYKADALFQSTARSSRACTVYLTQNLPSYANAFGAGPGSREAAEAFLGNLQTKIFHANGDPSTNQWSADSIGKARKIKISASISDGSRQRGGSTHNATAGGSLDTDYQIQPQQFTLLRTGGPENGFLVDAVIFQGGRSWRMDNQGRVQTLNHLTHSFSQK